MAIPSPPHEDEDQRNGSLSQLIQLDHLTHWVNSRAQPSYSVLAKFNYLARLLTLWSVSTGVSMWYSAMAQVRDFRNLKIMLMLLFCNSNYGLTSVMCISPVSMIEWSLYYHCQFESRCVMLKVCLLLSLEKWFIWFRLNLIKCVLI